MNYFAHTREDGQYQRLKDHLNGVAVLSQKFAHTFGMGYLGYLAGILHDVGKYSMQFQERIRGNPKSVDHSTAGAKWTLENQSQTDIFGTTKVDHLFAVMLAMIISGHHGGLKNFGTVDEQGSFQYRLANSVVPAWSTAWDEISIHKYDWKTDVIHHVSKWDEENRAWSYSFLGRMIYSCLVDADSIDTRDFCNFSDTSVDSAPTIAELRNKFDDFMAIKLADTEPTFINQRRNQILAACKRQAELSPRIFSLTVPTGGGKTLSSLAFALAHAQKYEKRRIIYVIPFTSIIEQNAAQFRAALGHDAVLEHHSNFNVDEYEEQYGQEDVLRLKLSAENWESPVVVTTSVQFFESLFANQRSKCRKLHNIANSIIILDEAQSIPRAYMNPCLKALEELIKSYECSVVLSTATQPSWLGLGFQPTEIMDDPTPDELMNDFKRVEVGIHGSNSEVITDSQVVDWVEETDQVLCIVNTRRHARILFDQIKERNVEGIYQLSGRLCAKHRSVILKEVKERLKVDLPCRLISTQLIEAGVDVDFPVVLRSYAGLDAIAQAAGRCNREGRREMGIVKVFYPESHGMPSRGWLKETATEAQNTLTYRTEPPLSLSNIQAYFERIYGIRDGQVDQITDSEGILNLLKSKNTSYEIPFQDISDRFQFIDGAMQAIVVPFDETAEELIKQLSINLYPMPFVRKLQTYSVQIYQYELKEFLKRRVVTNVNGVFVLTEKSFYDEKAGLLSLKDAPEQENLIY